MNLERELKLRVPDDFSLARVQRELNGYLAAAPQLERMHTFYYDSDDLRLQRWGCSLRYRRHEGWTLKIPAAEPDAGLAREEHVFKTDSDQVPKDALDLSAAYLRGARVRPVAELRTLRIKREIRDGDGNELAEVVEDDVRVVESSAVKKRFRQIEIELKDGADPSALEAIASALRQQGAGNEESTSKDAAARAAPEIAIPEIDRHSRAIDLIRNVFGKSVMRLIRTDAKLRSSEDAEAVHQSRVAVRRLRSQLRTFAPLLDEFWTDNLRERLSWLQDALSPVRDADVLQTLLENLAERLPFADAESSKALLDTLRAERVKLHRRLLGTLHSEEYIALLDDLVRAAQRPKALPASEKSARKVMTPVMRGVWKRARKAVSKAGRVPSDRELHRIRIKTKHLRYASEAFVCVEGDAAEYAEIAEDLQTILGDQHDGVVAVKRLRDIAAGDEHAFVAGELATLAHDAQCDARAHWKKAWRKLRRKRSRFWR